jgi:hypothetical protein
MFRTRENIRFVNFETFLLVLVILFGLLFFSDHSGSKFETKKKHDVSFNQLSQNFGIHTPEARLQVFQKSWISNRDNFNLLAFNRNPVCENRKVELKIEQLLLIRKSLSNTPQFIFRYHLFPREMDDPYFLG